MFTNIRNNCETACVVNRHRCPDKIQFVSENHGDAEQYVSTHRCPDKIQFVSENHGDAEQYVSTQSTTLCRQTYIVMRSIIEYLFICGGRCDVIFNIHLFIAVGYFSNHNKFIH